MYFCKGHKRKWEKVQKEYTKKKNAGELLVLSSSCCYHDKFHILNIRLILKLLVVFLFKLLMPTGHVMHQQFNIHQLYVLPTLYLFVL